MFNLTEKEVEVLSELYLKVLAKQKNRAFFLRKSFFYFCCAVVSLVHLKDFDDTISIVTAHAYKDPKFVKKLFNG